MPGDHADHHRRPGSGVGAINRQRGYTFKDDLTLPNIQFAGNHSLAVGFNFASPRFNFASVRLTSQNASSDLANATYYYAVTPGRVAATPYKLQYPNLTAASPRPASPPPPSICRLYPGRLEHRLAPDAQSRPALGS